MRLGRLDEAVAAMELAERYEDFLHSILVLHRAGLPCASALFQVAIGPDHSRVRELLGLHTPTSAYAKWTLDAWQQTPDALERITWWQRQPEVRRAHDELVDAWVNLRFDSVSEQAPRMREVRQRVAVRMRALEAVDPLSPPNSESVEDYRTGSPE